MIKERRGLDESYHICIDDRSELCTLSGSRAEGQSRSFTVKVAKKMSFRKFCLLGSVGVAGAYTSLLAYCKYTVGACKSNRDLNGRTVIVTGANTGIGLETARDLAARNARVILACRSQSKGEKAMQDIVTSTGNSNVVVKELDVSSFDSVRSFTKDILEKEKRLDVLVNNAGVIVPGKEKSADGIELTMATNHFGPFLLTNLLLPLMKESSRVVVVSSEGYQLSKLDVEDFEGEKVSPSDTFQMYYRSKHANILFTRELAERLKNTGVTVNALHPGVVQTELARDLGETLKKTFAFVVGPFMKDAKQGAQTSIYVAVSEELEGVSGKYFSDCKEYKVKKHALDENAAKRLWEYSEKVTNFSAPTK